MILGCLFVAIAVVSEWGVMYDSYSLYWAELALRCYAPSKIDMASSRKPTIYEANL